MKKIIIALSALFSLTSGQTFAADVVPATIVRSFIKTFNSARDITWEESNGYNVASFVQNGVKSSAYYDQDGQLVVVGTQINPTALPAQLASSLDQEFASFTVTTLFEMKDEYGTSYYATITDGKKVKVLKGDSKKWTVVRTKKK